MDALYLYSLYMLFCTILKCIWWRFEIRIFEQIDRDDLKLESTLGFICLGLIQCLVIVVNIIIMAYVNYLAFVPVVISLVAYVACDLPYMIRMNKNRDFTGDYRKLDWCLIITFGIYTLFMFGGVLGMTYLYQKHFVVFRILLFLLFMNQVPKIVKSFLLRTRPQWSYHTLILHTANYLPLIYFFGCPNNILNVQSDFKLYSSLATLIFFQVFLILFQKNNGNCYYPQRQYHQVVTKKREVKQESQVRRVYENSKFLLEFQQQQSELIQGECQDYDCSICLQTLFTMTKDSKEVIYKAQYQMMMLTKCNHLFHNDCLEIWFNQRQDCPNCRTEIIL